MSSSLVWRPPPTIENDLGYDLKFALAPRLWNHDGSLTSDWTEVGRKLVPFLEGLVAGGNIAMGRQAQTLIDLIDKYGRVQIRLVN